MTTTPTNSTVSAEQAREALSEALTEILLARGDDENTTMPEFRDLVLRRYDELIAQHIRRRFAAQGQSGAKVSRYPWKDAPWWAEFATTDSSGRSVWHQQMPTLFGSEWYSGGNMVQIEMNRLSGSTYKTSLEQRPTGGGG